MPNIGEFDAGNLLLRPTETGVEARAGTARRIGSFFSQQASAEETLARETSRLGSETNKLGSETAALGAEKGQALSDFGRRLGSSIDMAGSAAVKYLDHQQISQGAPAFANLMAQKTKEWNDTIKTANPNDPSVAKKFMDGLEPALAEFRDNGFYTESGKAWAEAHVDALRTHMQEKSMADMATMAGHAAVVNQQQTINSLSSTVHGDPSSLDFSLAALKSSTEGMLASSPNLTGVQASAARSEILQKGAESIVKSAAIGFIEKTGKMPEWATDPKYAPYINGAELKQFESAARVQQRADLIAQKQLETYQRQQVERAANDAFTKSRTDNISADDNGKLSINPKIIKDALAITRKYPEAGSGALDTTIRFVESQQNKELKVIDDPNVKSDLMTRMFSADKPTTTLDLMKARAEGKISDHTFQAYSGLVTELETSPLKGPVWQATAAAAKDALIVTVPGIPGKDTVGTANYSTFMQSFIPQYLAKSRAGTLEPNALDVKNPNSMISKAMDQFRRSGPDRMRDYVAGAGGLSVNEKGDVSGNVNRPATTPTVTTKTQYEALPVGTIYIGKDGQKYEKR